MSETIDQLLRFTFDRLPNPQIGNRKPCLEENWFVEDARPRSPNWLSDADLRRIWRVARMQRIGLEPGRGDPWLLLHQMRDVYYVMFSKAEEIFLAQRREMESLIVDPAA